MAGAFRRDPAAPSTGGTGAPATALTGLGQEVFTGRVGVGIGVGMARCFGSRAKDDYYDVISFSNYNV